MNKAIVTGANGFLGAALCSELAHKGICVTAVVRNEAEDITAIKNLPNIRIVYCDLKNFIDLAQYVSERDFDVCYHFAWAGVSGPARCDYELQINNVRFACDTLKACSDIGCRRFVFASSIMEYEVETVMNSTQTPDSSTLYSSAKHVTNYMLRALAASLGIEYIRAVISNVYGPGETNPRLINSSLRKMMAGEHCSFSPGEQMYDFIYITDAAAAFAAIGEHGKTNHSYYIGSSQPKKLKEFLCEMRDQVDPDIEIGIGELSFNGVFLLYNEFDKAALENEIGFVPSVSFSEGIRNTIEWLKGIEE
ncbi:MAG: NAD(P)-dependent oxidoreductase [Oscillospiraceae bacterium]|nr:NAD(P)-dependent oxidoreductase [Oscillospiraceae bacterium]